MMSKSLLAASVATGLIVPATAGVYLPPKPSIIKPENIEFSKNMLLGMPLTMGMLAAKGAPISGFTGTYTTGTTSAQPYSFTGCNIGTPASNRMIVVVSTAINPSGGTTFGTTTIGGVNATRAIDTNNANRPIMIDYAVVTTGTTATIDIRYGNNTGGIAIAVYAVYPSSTTPVDAIQTSAAGGVTTITLTDLAKTAGGFAVFGAHSIDQPATSTITMTGETVVSDASSSNFQSDITYNFSSIKKVASTTTTDDPLCTWNVSVRERGFAAATWV